MATGLGGSYGERTENHPNRQVTFKPSRTWGGDVIPNSYSVRTPSYFGGDHDYYKGTIRQSADYGDRWTGVMSGQHVSGRGGEVPAFNVRTEARARIVAGALATMPRQEAYDRTRGFRESFERRFDSMRAARRSSDG